MSAAPTLPGTPHQSRHHQILWRLAQRLNSQARLDAVKGIHNPRLVEEAEAVTSVLNDMNRRAAALPTTGPVKSDA
jgi:hypothetical protein